jgi:hypothetical protein
MGKKVLSDMSFPGSKLVFSLLQIGHLKKSGMAMLVRTPQVLSPFKISPMAFGPGHPYQRWRRLYRLSGWKFLARLRRATEYAATEAGGGQWILIST